jgi:hypothetical protein
MDVEIIIKGGQELSETYPGYTKFEKQLGQLIAESFPDETGWVISTKPAVDEPPKVALKREVYVVLRELISEGRIAITVSSPA